MFDSATLCTVVCQAPLSTKVGCHVPYQGIFWMQRLNLHFLCLLHWVLYHKCHLGNFGSNMEIGIKYRLIYIYIYLIWDAFEIDLINSLFCHNSLSYGSKSSSSTYGDIGHMRVKTKPCRSLIQTLELDNHTFSFLYS